ncbi:MAG: insulinase family protein [Candidatus Omnitrophica bacterium]|nr:insulinase family protein [Candidatus Omnitrophota bacterium]
MAVPERPIFSDLSSKERRPPAYLRKVLPNGLTVIVQQDRAHPLVAFHATVRTGSAREGAFLGTGISHVLEHMLFKGTSRRPVGAVEQEARSYGGTSQGFTTYDTTSYQLIVNKEFWSEGADLLVDALFFSSFDPAEFAKEKDVVLRELKLGKDDPDHLLWESLFETAYRVHPYRIPIIGYEPLLTKLSREEVVAYHRQWYRPHQIVLAVVGDVEPEAVFKRLEGLTAGIEPGRIALEPLPQEPPLTGPRQISREADVATAMAAVGFPSVAVAHPDLFALDLLARLLGGYRGSWLDRSLKETGIVHSVSSWNYTPQDPGLFVVTFRSEPEKVQEAVRGIWEQVERASKELFSQQEIESAKRALLRHYWADRQTVTGLAADLAGNEVLVGDPAFSYRYLEGIQSVSAEDIRRAALLYLKAQTATTVTLFPRGALERFGQQVSAPGAGGERHAEKEVLQNGLRILLREDHRVPLVTLQVSFLGGVRYETEENNGISTLTARMLMRGTPRRSAQQIVEEINGLGGTLHPFSGRNSIGLSMEVTPDGLEESMRLLADLILHSHFPEQELEKERQLLLAQIKTAEEDPFAWGAKRMMGTLFTTHPYRFDPSGDPDRVAKLRPEELRNFYKRVLVPERMVISIVGDFQKEKVLSMCRQAFGGLSAGTGEQVIHPPEPALSGPKEHVEAVSRKEGLIMIGFHTVGLSDPSIAELDLLDTILSGGAGRLFKEVREKRGLAYTVGSFAVHGLEPGAFVLYAVAEPAQIENIRKVLLEEISRLSTVPVPDKELQDAKQGLLGARRIARQTQSAEVSQLGLDELYGLGYDYPRRYEARIRELTSQQLRSFARTVLDSNRCAIVIGQPAGGEEAGSSGESGTLAEIVDVGPHGQKKR